MDELKKTAIGRLLLHFFPDGLPPSADMVLRDAVLEVGDAVATLEQRMWEIERRIDLLETPISAKKPRKKYKTRKKADVHRELAACRELNPSGGKGADHTVAPARAESEGSLPPTDSPAPSSRYGIEPGLSPDQLARGMHKEAKERARTAPFAAQGASLQTRPEHD